MTYEVNQIFIDDEDYSNKAEWCNKNGCYIEEIEPREDGTRQFQIKKPKEPTLEELRERKLSELSSKSSQFEQTENKDMVIISSLGFRVNADPKAKRNIDTLIELQVQTFRDYDNQDQSVTLEDLKTIKQEISINALNLYNQKWEMQREIRSLETVEQVNNYKIEFKMIDFTEL